MKLTKVVILVQINTEGLAFKFGLRKVNLSWYRATFLCSGKPAEYHLVMYSLSKKSEDLGNLRLEEGWLSFWATQWLPKSGRVGVFYSQKCFRWRGDFSLCRSLSGTVPMNCLPDTAYTLGRWLTHTLYLKAENITRLGKHGLKNIFGPDTTHLGWMIQGNQDKLEASFLGS